MADADTLQLLAIASSLAAATLVSEDLACISAGALVATGRVAFVPAALACFIGIVAGDLLLVLAGRLMGRRLLHWTVMRRLTNKDALQRSSEWLDRRGPVVALLARFTPGLRLPTYLAAGILHVNPVKFGAWLALAAAVWTPLLVGASALSSGELDRISSTFLQDLPLGIGLLAAALALPRWLQTPHRRRRLFGRWQRLSRWEFWSPWVFYVPVAAYIVLLMIRHRSVTIFTAANPGIPDGGFIGESKFAILRALSSGGDSTARAVLLPGDLPLDRRVRLATQFINNAGLIMPVVLKPDQGQRGTGVVIVRSPVDLPSRLRELPRDAILQEYVDGQEFGVFYIRHPDWPRGRVVSITRKCFPAVIGDDRRTLEELILDDARGVCLEHVHRRVHASRLSRVLAQGEILQLVEIGSHCRGAVFLDASHLWTPELESAIEAIASRFEGFHFGRFDMRVPSIDDFQRGINLKVLELNGVTSEPTHIYDPANSVSTAYRVLFEQWRVAFEIGAANVARGARPVRVRNLVRRIRRYRREARKRSLECVAGPHGAAYQAEVTA
jgi:membrane protein DedA with SNARE-associated domain